MEVKEMEFFRPACHPSSTMVNVKAFLDCDLSELMPYIKGELDDVKYFPKGPYIKFLVEGHPVVVDGNTVAVAGFADDGAARDFASKVVSILDDIESRKEEIEPDATPFDPPPAMELFKRLPKKASCSECGHPACMAFAVALTSEESSPEDCPHISEAMLAEISELLGK